MDQEPVAEKKRGRLMRVGFGPGNQEHLTFRAKEAIAEAEVVIEEGRFVQKEKVAKMAEKSDSAGSQRS